MKSTNHILHRAKINNNCPECYSTDGLEFTFSQTEKDGVLYSKASNEITEELKCHNCNNIIYPVSWDDDIERVHEYNKKLATPIKTSIKLKPLAYVLILLDALAIGALIYFLK